MRRIVLAAAFALLAAATACSRTTTPANDTGGLGSTSGETQREVTTQTGMGNVDEGKRVFGQNCATCHGATGVEGGVGPSLKGENRRKNYDATIVWIKHPQPPMPALYPSILSETEVDDVAAYVQSL